MSTDCNDSMQSKMMYGFILATVSGLMTLLGAATVYFPVPKKHLRLVSCFCLATASGVMGYVSLVEVLHESIANYEESLQQKNGSFSDCDESLCESCGAWAKLYATITFFAGWFLAVLMSEGLDRIMDK